MIIDRAVIRIRDRMLLPINNSRNAQFGIIYFCVRKKNNRETERAVSVDLPWLTKFNGPHVVIIFAV